ncbi:MAG: BLUF domain-containing protein [Rhizorhabdus sp.]
MTNLVCAANSEAQGSAWLVRWIMRRLIYTSRSLIDAGDIESIMSSSTARNEHVGVTGMLWVAGGYFAQVLEGDADQVATTMHRIRTDHRHTDIDVLFDHDVVSRQFGDWSMRYADDCEATAFMIGFALGQSTAGAARLYEIVIASLDAGGPLS